MPDPMDINFVQLLSESYARFTKGRLVPAESTRRAAPWLYDEAAFCVLAHDHDPDPRFVYANKAAQACFGYSWDELIGLPSRLSAEAPNRAERQALLERVASEGYAPGYRGLRIAKSGRRFWIEDGTVWQLIDASGVHHGQAAMFSSWRTA
jgi:PAS domain S-box-containing protein